eukprot:Tbor_TRINITY_DN5393_c0_g1::TRINITY_DN5393_c0_g1_i1::g.4773::m.4773
MPSSSLPTTSKGKVYLPRTVHHLHGFQLEVPSMYTIDSLLGRGAYGVVVSATVERGHTNSFIKGSIDSDKMGGVVGGARKDVESSEPIKVAIKKIGSVFQDLVDGKRILRELKLLHFMDHRNVLHLLDVFRPRVNTGIINSPALKFLSDREQVPDPKINEETDFFSDIYVVTECMSSDLGKVIRCDDNSLGEQHASLFIYQMCCGLNFIHNTARVIHRDVKPGNILIASPECIVKIADFGLARCVNGTDMTDYVATRYYRPPELLLVSDNYTTAIDMWAVGCIAVEILTGKALLPGTDYINQLVLITELLGTPTVEELKHVRSKEAVDFVRELPPTKRKDISTLFLREGYTKGEDEGKNSEKGPNDNKDKGEEDGKMDEDITPSPEMIDFVDKLLRMAPENRMTAREAMLHPWVKAHFSKDDLVTKVPPDVHFEFKYDSIDIDLDVLKSEMRETVDSLTLEPWKDVI